MEQELQRLNELATIVKNKRIRYADDDLSDESSSTESEPDTAE